jgi:hypothetical protein
LGNRRNLAEAGELGRATLIEGAEDAAERLAPVLRAVRSEGAKTHRAMAEALNRRGVKSPGRPRMAPSSIANLLSRCASLL